MARLGYRAPEPLKWKLKIVCALIASVSVGFVLVSEQVAFASTCTAGTDYYSGQQQVAPWQGVEGYISIDGLSLGASNSSHILNLEELKNYDTNVCTGITGVNGNCWLQDGYGRGTLPRPCDNAGGVYAYEENNDVNGYNCNWVRSIALPQNNFWNVYYTHQTSGDLGLLNGYIDTGEGPVLIGQAWVPSKAADLAPGALLEVYSAVTGTCPSVGQYQYFGTNGSGGTSSAYALYLSTNGSTWAQWTQAPDPLNDAPFNHRSVIANYYAFSTYGS